VPEGHTLHRLAEQFQRLFIGRPWRVTSPQGRFAAGAAQLDGRCPERAESWGKQLLVHVGADIWQVHLGLYGAFSFRGDTSFEGADTLGAPRSAAQQLQPEYDEDGWIIPQAPAGAVRARVHVPNGWADLRGPAQCRVLNPVQYEALISRLGPDPLRQPAGEAVGPLLDQFRSNLARRRVSIAAAVMDQAVIAGVGNIYRAESLFVEGIDPSTPANELSAARVESLWQTLTDQLRTGMAEGIIRTLRDEDPHRALRGTEVHHIRAGAPVRSGAAWRRHWVYQHHGTPCLRCGQTVQMRTLQGRRLYWCPGCQLR